MVGPIEGESRDQEVGQKGKGTLSHRPGAEVAGREEHLHRAETFLYIRATYKACFRESCFCLLIVEELMQKLLQTFVQRTGKGNQAGPVRLQEPKTKSCKIRRQQTTIAAVHLQSGRFRLWKCQRKRESFGPDQMKHVFLFRTGKTRQIFKSLSRTDIIKQLSAQSLIAPPNAPSTELSTGLETRCNTSTPPKG